MRIEFKMPSAKDAKERNSRKDRRRVLQFQGDDGTPPARPEHNDLVKALLAWFQDNKRPLPWRETYAPYEVWISEIMLQQTRMDRAAAYFERWMQRFPTVQSVADAHPDAVLKAWEGLGYYSRVRNLHKAAGIIAREHGGKIPGAMSALRALPGIGEYTAGAVLSIAFNQPYPAVDANVERVFARLFDVGHPVKSAAASGFIRHMAQALIPEGRARDFNQALMELGALICGKTARCESCPVATYCQAKHLGIPHERPVPGKKTGYSALSIVTGVLACNGRIFLQKRLDSGVWAGFWEFPGGRVERNEAPREAVAREFFEETEFRVRVIRELGLVRHSYTRYKIAMHCFVLALKTGIDSLPLGNDGYPLPHLNAATQYRWVLPEELDAFTFPAGHRKLIDAWLPELRRICLESFTQS